MGTARQALVSLTDAEILAAAVNAVDVHARAQATPDTAEVLAQSIRVLLQAADAIGEDELESTARTGPIELGDFLMSRSEANILAHEADARLASSLVSGDVYMRRVLYHSVLLTVLEDAAAAAGAPPPPSFRYERSRRKGH